MNKEFTASLHTHVRSQFDAHIEPEKLCSRIKELGGVGCAITDHGVLTSIEDYRRVFAAEELKLIPGCELYVDGGILGRLHLVVLAKDDIGYKGICEMVTVSNYTLQSGYPVISEDKVLEIARKYTGHIFALTACMQGVLPVIFLLNKKVEKKIEGLKEKQGAYLNPCSPELSTLESNIKSAKKEYEAAINFREELKALAGMRFAKRTKTIDKMEDGPEKEAAKASLEADMAKSENASKKLPDAKSNAASAKKALSAAEKAAKEANASVDKYLEYEEQIEELKKELKSPDELEEMAAEKLKVYQSSFGSSYVYAELQYHGIEEERVCFPEVAKLANKLGIPVVATNDVHILNNTEDDRLKRQILRSMRFGKEFEEEGDGDSELYLKTDNELAKTLEEILPVDVVKKAIENIAVIFNECNVNFETGKHYPVFEKGSDANELLDRAIEEGIKYRFPEGMDEEHKKRLAYELPIIKSMGYADYHLIVKDFLEYGRLLGYLPENEIENAPLTIEELENLIREKGYKNQGLLTGPGRGSAVGSLVCYLLGITHLDPLKYGLLFERFLNPERVSMPKQYWAFGVNCIAHRCA